MHLFDQLTMSSLACCLIEWPAVLSFDPTHCCCAICVIVRLYALSLGPTGCDWARHIVMGPSLFATLPYHMQVLGASYHHVGLGLSLWQLLHRQ